MEDEDYRYAMIEDDAFYVAGILVMVFVAALLFGLGILVGWWLA